MEINSGAFAAKFCVFSGLIIHPPATPEVEVARKCHRLENFIIIMALQICIREIKKLFPLAPNETLKWISLRTDFSPFSLFFAEKILN